MSWIIFTAKLNLQLKSLVFRSYGVNNWDVPNLAFGALPYIYGTLVTSAIALLLAVPSGVSSSFSYE